MNKENYPTNLTDNQWNAILQIFNDKGKRKHSLRDILNAIFYLLKIGCQWCMLPMEVIATLRYRFERLVTIIANGGYRGELIENVKTSFNWILDVVLRKDCQSKFEVLPKRWIVERTFSWFESYRRLSKDFEFHTNTSESMIQLAMIKLMLNRIHE